MKIKINTLLKGLTNLLVSDIIVLRDRGTNRQKRRDKMNSTIIFFTAITLINVILSTVKSVLTIRSTREVAALINAISYGFYAMVVKQMATVSTEIVVIATVFCNLIGVYFSMWLLDKFKKDVSWKITVIPQAKDFTKVKDDLVYNKIGFNEYEISTKYGQQKALDIFSESKLESSIVKNILAQAEKTKYHIIEIGQQI